MLVQYSETAGRILLPGLGPPSTSAPGNANASTRLNSPVSDLPEILPAVTDGRTDGGTSFDWRSVGLRTPPPPDYDDGPPGPKGLLDIVISLRAGGRSSMSGRGSDALSSSVRLVRLPICRLIDQVA